MNKFRRSKVYCAIVIAMNLAGLGEANADPTSDGIGGQLKTDGQLGLTTPRDIPKNNGVYNVDAKGDAVFSSSGKNVFFSFSNFRIDTNESAVFDCSAGCGNTSNVITRVNSNPAEVYGNLTSKINSANFYLLSDQGVIFGKNATIDVPGALHVGATNTLIFSAGQNLDGNTTNASTLDADPKAFGFLIANSLSKITLGEDDKSVGKPNITHITASGPVELSAEQVEVAAGSTLDAKTKGTNTISSTLDIKAIQVGNGPSGITIRNGSNLTESSGGKVTLETSNSGVDTQSGNITVESGATVNNVSSLKSDFSNVTVKGTVNMVSTVAKASTVSAGGILTVDTGGTVEDKGDGNLTVAAVTGPVNVNGLLKSSGDLTVTVNPSASILTATTGTTQAGKNLNVQGGHRLIERRHHHGKPRCHCARDGCELVGRSPSHGGQPRIRGGRWGHQRQRDWHSQRPRGQCVGVWQ
ncbi:MAG: filamentous hemagglutinin N-terminal domain-containing protein [Proteobacteria bacterium]|nr:filamentous hemagglutinin N-terminal domain-containing protein [Pseudomonadota bacterium]